MKSSFPEALPEGYFHWFDLHPLEAYLRVDLLFSFAEKTLSHWSTWKRLPERFRSPESEAREESMNWRRKDMPSPVLLRQVQSSRL